MIPMYYLTQWQPEAAPPATTRPIGLTLVGVGLSLALLLLTH